MSLYICMKRCTTLIGVKVCNHQRLVQRTRRIGHRYMWRRNDCVHVAVHHAGHEGESRADEGHQQNCDTSQHTPPHAELRGKRIEAPSVDGPRAEQDIDALAELCDAPDVRAVCPPQFRACWPSLSRC